MTTNQSTMTSIIRQLISEYHEKGMTLVDILERQIEAGHPAHEFIRVYKEMYPDESTCKPSTGIQATPSQMPGSDQVAIPGPLANGRSMLFACANGYLDLVDCRFVPTRTADADELSSRTNFPDVYSHDGPSMEAGYLGLQDYLDQIFPDPQIQNYVLNLYAEKLDGVHRRNEFVIHLGSGANGKSVFQYLLQETFGDYYQNNCVVKPNSRIAIFDYNWLIKEPNFIRASSSGERCIRGLTYGCIYDFSMCMINTEVNKMPQFNEAGLKRRIRIIPYSSCFVNANDPKLSDPITYPNHFPSDYNIYKTLKNLAPIFLKELFERYKVLKANGFKQLEENIPSGVSLLSYASPDD